MASNYVKIQLADPGHAIKTMEFELKGLDSKIVEETEMVKTYRKKGILLTSPAEAPAKPESRKPAVKPDPKKDEKPASESSDAN